MKYGMALMGATLALALAPAANAQLVITFGAPTLTGNVLAYPADITSTSSTPVIINSSSFTVPSGVQLFDNLEGIFADGTNDPSLSALPLTIAPHGSDHEDPLFELIVPAGTPLSTVTYSVSDGQGTTLGTGSLSIGTSAVPEPGSVALLAGGLVSGGLFVARRRRK